jgi:CRISPR system Cascade subunit CasA
MPYNLIDEQWLPVRRASGAHGWIAPWEFGDPDDPPLRIESGRPDFDGALIQFLIGLMQTASAPASFAEWRDWQRHPLPPSDLRARFQPVRHAFDLDGDGPRFMQEERLQSADETSVAALLIDSPGENTLKKNADHFVKRGRVEALSFPAAAAALFALQINAPSGGVGHRTSLRGGGPLTTVVSRETLWQSVVANLLTRTRFLETVPGESQLSDPTHTFPWLGPPSPDTRKEITPAELHPAAHFWATPRRVLLTSVTATRCDIYGTIGSAFTSYRTKNYGNNYKGEFQHPLTPYVVTRQGSAASLKGRPLFPYRDWLKVTLGDTEHRPAQVVANYYAESREGADSTLLAFGYAMDNMKPLSWSSATTPLLGVGLDDDQRMILRDTAHRFIEASEIVRNALRSCVREAWFPDRDPRRKSDMTMTDGTFWDQTEDEFYLAMAATGRKLADGSDEREDNLAESWLVHLQRTAISIFDQQAGLIGDLIHSNLARIAQARQKLTGLTHPKGKTLRQKIGLPALYNKTTGGSHD